MLVYKFWVKNKRGTIYSYRNTWEGWFLLGFIPLYIRMIKSEKY